MLPNEIQQAVSFGNSRIQIESAARSKVEEVYQKAELVFARTFTRPLIRFDLEGRTAGTANKGKNLIRFNFPLLRDNFDKFINSTVGHECGHQIADTVYNRRCMHGAEWRTVMVRLGFKPSRCHTYETTSARVHTKFKYFCNCAGKVIEVGQKIHFKIKAGHVYTCKRCKGGLMSYSESGQTSRVIGARTTGSGWSLV